MLYLYKGERKSRGAVAVAKALDIPVLTPTNTMRADRRGCVIINWGCSRMAAIPPGNTIWNRPEAVLNAAEKLATFRCLRKAGVSAVPSTTDKWVAQDWADMGHKVFCRVTTFAQEGKDIVVASKASEIVDAPLYTRHIPRKSEWRVGVVHGQVVDMQYKAQKPGFKNAMVANFENGFLFCRDGIEDFPKALLGILKEVAIAATKACALDFAGVDCLEGQDGRIYVLELNSSPGLDGQRSIDAYAKAFKAAYAR